MKISHAKVLITFLLYIDAAFAETIKINISRLIPPGEDKNNWEIVDDSFTIPLSVCNEKSSGYKDYCKRKCTFKQGEGSEGSYSCSCPEDRATVTYLTNRWICLKNKDARNRLGCEENNFLFDGEEKKQRLRTLNTDEKRKIRIPLANCTVNIKSSWYIGCFGEKFSLARHATGTEDIFDLRWNKNDNAHYIKVVKPIDILLGRVINLGISCPESSSSSKEGCLLFKLEGNLTCPVERPIGPVASSTIQPTTSSLEVTMPMTILNTATDELSVSPTQTYLGKASSSATIGTTETYLWKASSSATIGATQAITRPSSGKKQKNEGHSSSSPMGIIAGVTASVTLLLLLIVAFFVYRRRKSRKDGHKSVPGQIDKKTLARNPKTNSAFELEEQKGFVKNHDKKLTATVYDVPHQQTVSSEKNSQSGGLYAVLNVPEGHNIYASRDSQHEMSQNYDLSSAEQPVYNVLEDLSVKGSEEIANNGPYEPEPVYNVLEEPHGEVSEEPAWYGSAPVDDPVYNTLEEPNQNTGSIYKNEPVYNVLEGPEVSEEPTWYGSAPVDHPVYNTLEEPNQSIGSTDINDPVYNVLEGPEQRGAGEEDRYGPSDVQEPLYNVLEGPDPEASKDGLFSNSLDPQDPGSCNANIPVYAVVNKKKKMTR